MRLFKFVLVFLISTVIGQNVFAQGWERTYFTGSSDRGKRILPQDDGGFLIAALHQNRQRLLRVNVDGDLMATIDFNNNPIRDMKETSDGGYILVNSINAQNPSSITLIKLNSDLEEDWRSVVDSVPTYFAKSVIETFDGSFLVAGSYTPETPYALRSMVILKFTAQGVLQYKRFHEYPMGDDDPISIVESTDHQYGIWSNVITDTSSTLTQGKFTQLNIEDGSLLNTNIYPWRSGQMIASDDNHFWVAAYLSGKVRLSKIDTAGILVIDTALELPFSSPFTKSFLLDNDGNLIIAGWHSNNESDVFLCKVTLEGEVLWQRSYGGIKSDNVNDLISIENGYAMIGDTRSFGLNTSTVYLILTDSLGYSNTNYIEGRVFYDTLANCNSNNDGISLEGWKVKAAGYDFNYYGVTDENGAYSIRVNTGDFEVSVLVPNVYWQSCISDSMVTMNQPHDTSFINFPILADYLCPIINVDVSTPFLRRCFENNYTVSYCNEGTSDAEEVLIEVTFDEFLTVNSSTTPWLDQNNQTYTFNVGDLEVGECNQFYINVTLDCDSTVLGQTHCVEAHVFPDSICLPPNTLWDGSTIEVRGECEEDSIQFSIKNTGANDMENLLNFIIIQDQIIHVHGNFQLPAGDSQEINIEANGATYRMEAEQSPFHPTVSAPSVTVEGCATANDPISLGFVNFYSDDDADPFRSIDCQESIGSWDPNDKRGFPKGIGMDQIIYADTDLEYHIRFQNTGTDIAFNVVIRDTISEYLDIETLRPGASSHPYQWQLMNDNMIKFSFDNIMLPDSNANEVASHGFVKFKIKQKDNNPLGTVIENKAAIYFDFNAPVITNQTRHQIGERPFIVDSLYTSYCNTFFYDQDTNFTSFSELPSFDFETTHFINVSSPVFTTIDTMLVIGSTFEGMTYNNDTTFYKDLLTTAGCDSLVTVNIITLVSAVSSTEEAVNHFSIHPNPSNGLTRLVLDLKEARTIQLQLRNQLGARIAIPTQEYYQAGQHIIPINYSELSSGIYLLEIQEISIQQQSTQKLLKLIVF